MSITSSSTPAQIRAAYLDNVGYETAGSAAMAMAFIEACRALLIVLPAMTGTAGSTTQFSPQLIQGQLEEARLWLSQNPASGAGGGSKHFAFEDFRDERGYGHRGCP